MSCSVDPRIDCPCEDSERCGHVAPEPPELVTPMLAQSGDRIYPRCVWCRGENYALAVIAYSRGEIPCAAVGGCGRYLPEDYRLPAGGAR